MTISTINRILHLFSDAFRDLSVQIPMADVERLAILVHHSMEHGRRIYHRSEHLFQMAEGMNPRQVLAVLFHDIVYYQLDDGLPEKAEALLKVTIRIEDNQVIILPFDAEDFCASLCVGLFGFESGSRLPLFGGMNEFLSALVATRLLEPYLPRADLVAIATSIEATIPFRSESSSGQTMFSQAEERVIQLNSALAVGLTTDDTRRLMADAVLVANRDVVNFSAADPGYFLATTWQLIEESNAPLAAMGVYLVSEYREALLRMERFLATLNPDHVFHSYRDRPSAREVASLSAAARQNIEFSLRYLDAKIVSVALLEALAVATGGDCPVSMLLGDVHSRANRQDRIENFLPTLTHEQPTDPILLSVLEKGRSIEAINDLTTSPLTAYLYRSEGAEGITKGLMQAKRMFSGEIDAGSFLLSLPPPLVRAVANACAKIAFSRASALQALPAGV